VTKVSSPPARPSIGESFDGSSSSGKTIWKLRYNCSAAISLKCFETRERAMRSVDEACGRRADQKWTRRFWCSTTFSSASGKLTCLKISFCVSDGRSRIVTFLAGGSEAAVVGAAMGSAASVSMVVGECCCCCCCCC
jgi:hypothetical protein